MRSSLPGASFIGSPLRDGLALAAYDRGELHSLEEVGAAHDECAVYPGCWRREHAEMRQHTRQDWIDYLVQIEIEQSVRLERMQQIRLYLNTLIHLQKLRSTSCRTGQAGHKL